MKSPRHREQRKAIDPVVSAQRCVAELLCWRGLVCCMVAAALIEESHVLCIGPSLGLGLGLIVGEGVQKHLGSPDPDCRANMWQSRLIFTCNWIAFVFDTEQFNKAARLCCLAVCRLRSYRPSIYWIIRLQITPTWSCCL